MGSDAHVGLTINESTGLIPRFMADLFAALGSNNNNSNDPNNNPSTPQYLVQASFLEVYGEDVHDLLVPSRPSLPLREDANGGVVCQGLTQRHVSTAAQALEVLQQGTWNRTTASTWMNVSSSRSHAVFTVHLTTSTNGGSSSTSSRFTFVDLAGSERMKKTGAEGERAREGIKINEGLLALGNVINALAFQKAHIPYRQSKLTRLLQDALGGNSQTVFLACVSPSDTNASETLSTLHYANRARDIQNAPTRNRDDDPRAAENQRLVKLNQLLERELVALKFFPGGVDQHGGREWQEKQTDIDQYLANLYAEAEREGTAQGAAAPPALFGPAAQVLLHSTAAASHTSMKVELVSFDDPSKGPEHDLNKSVLDPDLAHLNPDEDLAILDQLLELQQRDQEFDANQKKELAEVEGELAEQQQLLHKLRNSLHTYHELKAKYELVMVELQQLEKEKAHLAEQLVTASADPSKGCSKSIQKELERVEQSLARARNETRKHRELYRKAEQEAKKCGALERTVAELKSSRAKLQRQQRLAAAQHRETTEAKTREILSLKKKERTAVQQVSKLQQEIAVHKRNLGKRQEYCHKLAGKLKQTEGHLVKLLALRRRRTSVFASGSTSRESQHAAVTNAASVVAPQEVASFQYLVDQFVATQVEQAQLKAHYEERVNDYSQAMRDLVAVVKSLEERDNEDAPSSSSASLDAEQSVQELELKVELLGDDLQALRDRMDDRSDVDVAGENAINEMDSDLRLLLEDKDAAVLQCIVKELIDSLIDSQLRSYQLERSQKRTESVRQGLEDEVESLTNQLDGVSKELRRYKDEAPQSLVSEQAIQELQVDKARLLENLQHVQQAMSSLQQSNEDASKIQRLLESDLLDAREALAVHLATERHQSLGPQASNQVLCEMQVIWKELGVSAAPREQVRREIESSLEDTCARKLRDAHELRAKTLSDIESVRAEIEFIQGQLGVQRAYPNPSAPLLDQLDELRKLRESLEPSFSSATAKAESIVQHAYDIASILDLPTSDLPLDLRRLGERGTSPGSLCDDFLQSCERHLSALRLKKSELLAKNAVLMRETNNLIVEMNLRSEQILPLVVQSQQNRQLVQPIWWDDSLASTVAAALSLPGGVARIAPAFSQHLRFISSCLESVAQGRRSLSNSLQDLIERSQKTLLATVEGEEVDASEAYATFHDALFRLPALSKERIHACVVEVGALLAGVEAMTQSEIEALTVVWEAMEVSTSDRGRFWDDVEGSVKAKEADPVGPFDNVLQACRLDCEEWVLAAIRDSTNAYRQLEARLLKLERIHGEVERLRGRQDAKSSIISLDLEVRMLSAQLSEFEDKKCNKERLLTKKSNSSHLLKEERFRKQMQQKFSSKLEHLANLLNTWRSEVGYEVDPNLLSEEVRFLLKNSDDPSALVEKRTEFMHLRTVKPSKRPPLAVAGSSTLKTSQKGLSEVDKLRFLTAGATSPSPPAPALKRSASSDGARHAKKRKTDASTISSPATGVGPRTASLRATAAMPSRPGKLPPFGACNPPLLSSRPLSPLAAPAKRPTLQPFGRVLDEAASPQHRPNERSIWASPHGDDGHNNKTRDEENRGGKRD